MSRTETIVARAPAGVVRVDGADRVDLLHRLSTNDLRALAEPGRMVSTIFTTSKGRIVDWVWLIAAPDHLLMRVSPGRAARLVDWIDTYTIMEDVHCSDLSSAWDLVVMQGPAAVRAAGLDGPPEAGRAIARDRGWWARGLAAYGPRVEGLVPAETVDRIVDRAASEASQVGSDWLEMARLRAGVPSPAAEFAEQVNPLELRLAAHAVSFTKGCYIGQEVISRLDSYDKLSRALIGFETDAAVAPGAELKLARDGKTLGRVTSLAPLREGGAIGLGIVRQEAACSGSADLLTPAGAVPARLVERPFWTAS